MCGIHGLIHLSGTQEITATHLDSMGNITTHRGPDDSGMHLAQGEAISVGIGMRRLSIIDLEGGHQPIANEDETLHLVCNGEIYNFQPLRDELIGRDHQFRTGSDVEVILHLYEEMGDRCVERLNGMFAFALWDSRRNRVLIARDRIGVKPLYVARKDGYLAFSTEVKAILALPMFSAAINHRALPHYLELGYVPAPLTLFEGISKLEVASRLVIESGEVSQQCYWKPDYTTKPENQARTPEEWSAAVGEQIETSVKRQMISDVPIGAFLSGGIDSSAVVAMMAKHSSQPVRTYAIGFDTGKAGQFYNELPYARQVAELFGTEHQEILVRPDIVSLIPKLLWHMDEPIADSAYITTYLVSEFARKDVTVILSGVGGDELFAGYRRYLGELYAGRYQKLPGWLRKGVISPLASRLPADRHSKWLNYMRLARSFVSSAETTFEHRYHSYIEVFSREMQDALLIDTKQHKQHRSRVNQLLQQTGDTQALWKMFDLDRQTQLPDDLLMLTDKMTMATSLECRVPLLDQDLVDLATQIPEQTLLARGELKSVLKNSLKGVLPDSILYRAKRGFGAPMGAWLKSELAGLRASLLNRQAVEARGLFQWESIASCIHQHDNNQADHTDHLLALMNLEIWCRLYLDGCSSNDISDEIKEAI